MTALDLRNTVWLMTGLALVALPHSERLPALIIAIAAGLGIWRLYLARKALALPGKWILLGVVIGGTAAVFLHYRTIFGRDAGVALLVIMLALKLLEAKTQRDGMLLILLSYFLVITNFFYSQTIPTAVYMMACVLFVTAGMIGLNYGRAPQSATVQVRLAGMMLLQAVPLMLVLFVLFPRVQGPLWGMPSDAYSATTGLSDTMSPGTMSELIASDAVAFRVAFNGNVPGPRNLYWRGPVLWDYDGRTWTAPRFHYGELRYELLGPPTEYTVTMEPHSRRWLFAIDLPGRIPAQATATPDFQLLSTAPIAARMRYDMVSYVNYKLGVQDAGFTLRRALVLPPDFNPRTVALGKNLRQQHGTDNRAIIDAALRRFGTERFSYTMTPPLLGRHAADEFLFDTQQGYCEHYASAFTILMRAAGIPARVVTGYLGGELNPLGDYFIVRQADAHAWTEVWLEGEGWIRIDPTAAVSPARIDRGITAAVPRGEGLSFFMRADYPWLNRMRLTWDSFAYRWSQWVLGYNPDRQRFFLSRVGLDDISWKALTALLVVITGIAVLVLAALTLYRLRARAKDPVLRIYEQFCRKLARRGLGRAAAEGPRDYAARVCNARPDLASVVNEISDLYVALRYAPSAPADVAQFRRLTRAFRA